MYGFRPILTGSVRERNRADESFIDGRLKRDSRRERTKQARIFSLTVSATATEIILGSDRFDGELRLCRQWNRKVGDFWKRRGARSLRILAGCKKNKDWTQHYLWSHAGFGLRRKGVNLVVKFKASDVRLAVKVRTCHSLGVGKHKKLTKHLHMVFNY